MKKGILVLLVFAAVAGSAFAFDILSFPPPVEGGSIMIDAGIGMRALGLSGHTMSIPPLFAQAEYALPVGVPISVGAAVSFGQWKWEMMGFGYTVTYITPHARANWHWGFDVPWLDLYSGLSLGWDIARLKWTDDWGLGSLMGSGGASSGLYWSFQAGAHFYFSRNIGAVVETGYPYWIKAGIALKFGGSGASGGSGGSGASASRSSGDFMLVNADSLNIRGGPSADHEVVGVAPRDARVQVLERPGQWWRIRYGNIEGYVNSSFLRPGR